MYASSSLLIQMIQASIIRSSQKFQPSLSSGFLISPSFFVYFDLLQFLLG
ncbi:hypothetical protein Hdeb2414_s0480g00902171 [Helianthus debilis subsp. tardiflorus]